MLNGDNTCCMLHLDCPRKGSFVKQSNEATASGRDFKMWDILGGLWIIEGMFLKRLLLPYVFLFSPSPPSYLGRQFSSPLLPHTRGQK